MPWAKELRPPTPKRRTCLRPRGNSTAVDWPWVRNHPVPRPMDEPMATVRFPLNLRAHCVTNEPVTALPSRGGQSAQTSVTPDVQCPDESGLPARADTLARTDQRSCNSISSCSRWHPPQQCGSGGKLANIHSSSALRWSIAARSRSSYWCYFSVIGSSLLQKKKGGAAQKKRARANLANS